MSKSLWNTRVDSLWKDVHYAARTLWKSRGFTAVSVVTLALGIGASTAIFSVIDSVLLDPLPYPDTGRMAVVTIHDTDQNQTGGRMIFTDREFVDYQQQNHGFENVVGASGRDYLYSTKEGTEQFRGEMVTPGTFEYYGMPALIGRLPRAEDYEPNAPPTFLLHYKAWASRFNGDRGLLGKTFILNGVARTLIGVMPPRFTAGNGDFWIPQKPDPAVARTIENGAPRFWFLQGRLKPGITLAQADADLDVIAHNLAKIYPSDYPKHFTVQTHHLVEWAVGQFRYTLFIVLAAVGLLLLIGCGNVANLLLARATIREKEFAIRAALGASRWRLTRQLLVESFILAFSGAVLGSLFAWGGLKGLIAVIPLQTLPSQIVVRINSVALLFTLALATCSAFIFGLLPALKASHRDLNDGLRDANKGAVAGSGHTRLRNVVVVLEVAVSLTMLVTAGLLMRSFVALHEMNLGLRPDHVFVARLPLPLERYKTADQLAGFYRPLLARLKNIHGVVDATETSTLPPYGGIPSDIEIPGKTHSEKWNSALQLCSEGYFPTLRIQFVRGRSFTESEVNGARKLAVINQTFQRKYFGNDDPIGRTVRAGGLAEFPDPVRDPSFEVIGIVADVKNQGLQEPIIPEMWVPYTVTGSAFRGILVRTTGDPLLVMSSVRQEVWALDRGVAMTFTGSLEGYINSFSYAQPRFGFVLITVFASMGLILVAIGVYSVIAYTTAYRTHEIGIRMALGASASDVQVLVIRTGLKLVALGIGIGLVASFALSRVIASQLWGVSAHDPVTLAVVPFLLLIIGISACWIPSRRAAKVDPIIALRCE